MEKVCQSLAAQRQTSAFANGCVSACLSLACCEGQLFLTCVEQEVRAQQPIERLVSLELGRTFALPVPHGRFHAGNSLLHCSWLACSSPSFSYSFYCCAPFNLAAVCVLECSEQVAPSWLGPHVVGTFLTFYWLLTS